MRIVLCRGVTLNTNNQFFRANKICSRLSRDNRSRTLGKSVEIQISTAMARLSKRYWKKRIAFDMQNMKTTTKRIDG